MRGPLAALTLCAVLGAPSSAAENVDRGSSGMGSLIMGSWKEAEREGHKDFCFTGLEVAMNRYHESKMAANEKERAEQSGYYNAVTTFFKTPGLPRFSVSVREPNGKGPNDPTFPLYHYMEHVDGDTTVGRRECIGKLEVDYGRAVAIAVEMGLRLSEGTAQYLELRLAAEPEEPGWADKRLRGKTYWRVVETLDGRAREFFIDAVTGKPLRVPPIKK